MNKKGDLATGVLLVLAIVLAVGVLMNFVSFNNGLFDEAGKFSKTREVFRFSESYVKEVFEDSVSQTIDSLKGLSEGVSDEDFEGLFRAEFERIVAERDLRLLEGGDFFGKVRTGDYDLDKSESEDRVYILIVKDVLVRGSFAGSEIKKRVDLEKRFDNYGFLEDSDYVLSSVFVGHGALGQEIFEGRFFLNNKEFPVILIYGEIRMGKFGPGGKLVLEGEPVGYVRGESVKESFISIDNLESVEVLYGDSFAGKMLKNRISWLDGKKLIEFMEWDKIPASFFEVS